MCPCVRVVPAPTAQVPVGCQIALLARLPVEPQPTNIMVRYTRSRRLPAGTRQRRGRSGEVEGDGQPKIYYKPTRCNVSIMFH
jgi:hypothetical protein